MTEITINHLIYPRIVEIRKIKAHIKEVPDKIRNHVCGEWLCYYKKESSE